MYLVSSCGTVKYFALLSTTLSLHFASPTVSFTAAAMVSFGSGGPAGGNDGGNDGGSVGGNEGGVDGGSKGGVAGGSGGAEGGREGGIEGGTDGAVGDAAQQWPYSQPSVP